MPRERQKASYRKLVEKSKEGWINHSRQFWEPSGSTRVYIFFPSQSKLTKQRVYCVNGEDLEGPCHPLALVQELNPALSSNDFMVMIFYDLFSPFLMTFFWRNLSHGIMILFFSHVGFWFVWKYSYCYFLKYFSCWNILK